MPGTSATFSFAALLLAWPVHAMAEAAAALPATTAPATATAASGSFLWDLMAVVVPLLLIIACLVAVLYFARRRYKLTGRNAPLAIVQVLPVGPRERLVVVRTRADRVFAIGVGPQSLNLIAELDPADIALEPTTPATPSSGRSGEHG